MHTPIHEILFKYVTTAIAGLIIIWNSIELFFIVRAKKQRFTIGIVYIFNLCLSDIFCGVMMLVFKSMHFLNDTSLMENQVFQTFMSIFQYAFIRSSLFLSVFNSIALTVDRTFAITRPMVHRKIQKRFAIRVCFLVWFLSAVCVTTLYCALHFTGKKVKRYIDLAFPVASYSATLVFIFSYWHIFRNVRAHAHHMRTTSRNTISQEVKVREIQRRVEMRIMKLSFKSAIGFFVCWIPISTCSLFFAVNNSKCGHKDMKGFLFTLAFMNSLVNPCLYFSYVRKIIKNESRSRKRFSESMAMSVYRNTTVRTVGEQEIGERELSTVEGTPEVNQRNDQREEQVEGNQATEE